MRPISQSSNLSFLMVYPSDFFMEETIEQQQKSITTDPYKQQSIIYNMISMIIFLFLVAMVTSASSDFTLTLTSAGTSKVIPVLQPCSCQLAVFPVYNYTYNVTVDILTSQTFNYAQIYVPDQGICANVSLNSSKRVGFPVDNVNFGNHTQVTQRIYVKLLNQVKECTSDEENERVVYLVNKDEQQKYDYGIYLPKDSVILTQILAFVALIILCSNIKYRRISPVRFGYVFAVLYPIFLFATVYVSTYVSETQDYAYYGAMIFSFIFLSLYFADLLSYCSDKPFMIYSLSIFIGLVIMVIDMYILIDAWFVNDLIAIFVTGTMVKFVVIKKMRTSIFPMLLLWIFFVLRQFAIDFQLQNFQQALEIRIIPLFLQIPTLLYDSHSGYPCSAFGTSKIVTMGLILNYAIRIDLFLSGHFYTIITSVTAAICMFLEVIIAVTIQELPVIEYLGVIIFIPVATTVMLLAASKRGEWAQIWHGSFHDIAVDRKSVKKESSQLNEQEINRNLEQLEMNPSLLSDN